MSSSSEEDIPLAQLMKKTPAKKRKAPAKKRKATTKKRKTPAKKTKTPAKRKTPAKKRKKVSESEEDDDSEYSESSEDSSDSEDEVLANMKKKNSKPKASATKKKRARSKSRSAPKKRAKKIKANKAQKSSTENEYKTSIDDFKNGPAGSRKINYTQDIKLQLSLAVLCRWWYVMEWPSKTGPHPGPNYAEMAVSWRVRDNDAIAHPSSPYNPSTCAESSCLSPLCTFEFVCILTILEYFTIRTYEQF